MVSLHPHISYFSPFHHVLISLIDPPTLPFFLHPVLLSYFYLYPSIHSSTSCLSIPPPCHNPRKPLFYLSITSIPYSISSSHSPLPLSHAPYLMLLILYPFYLSIMFFSPFSCPPFHSLLLYLFFCPAVKLYLNLFNKFNLSTHLLYLTIMPFFPHFIFHLLIFVLLRSHS